MKLQLSFYCTDITDFKNKLKTYLFKSAFDIQWLHLLIAFYLISSYVFTRVFMRFSFSFI